MRITISFELDNVMADDSLASLINSALGGEPVKARKPRKPRKPMSHEQKAAFRKRMVDGQQKAAAERVAAEKPKATKKPASKKKKK